MWTSHVYGASIVLRASGLNFDPAFASYLMVIGYIFDRNKCSRIMYLISTAFSQSRTGFITILLVAFMEVFWNGSLQIKKNTFIKRLFFGIVLMVGLLYLYKISFVREQIDSIIDRIGDIFIRSDVSTQRHTFYPIIAMRCWARFNNVFYWLFGAGPRASGIITVNVLGANSLISSSNYVWSLECDFAELLISYGLLGSILYYYSLIKIFASKERLERIFSVALFIMGFMYNYSSLSINIIVIIFIILRLNAYKKC